MKSSSFLFLAVMLSALVIVGCKNRQNGNRNNRVKGNDKVVILEKVQKAAADYDIMYFKGKADFEGEQDGKTQSMGFSYKVYLAKDSLMWASISKMGIPAVTALIDQDSVKIRVSLNKMAMLCDFSVLSNMMGMDVNFNLLQSFFTGDPNLEAEKLTLVPSGDKRIQLREERPPYQVSWFLNAQHHKLEKMVAEDVTLGRSSSIDYSDFRTVSGYQLPGHALIQATQKGKVRIELQHSTIEIEPSKSTFKFRIPNSYDIKNCTMQ